VHLKVFYDTWQWSACSCVFSLCASYFGVQQYFGHPVWSPSLICDNEKLEKVQRRFTKRLCGMSCLSYDEHLASMGLPRLELRRLHLDLMYCYKIVFGLVTVNMNDFFEFRSTTKTRGHAYKLFKPRCSVRSNFFVERVVNVWNSLPSSVCFSSLSSFRRTTCDVDFTDFMKCT